MKRLLMTTIASLMIAGTFSLPAVAQQGGRHDRGGHASQQGDHNGQGARGDHGDRGDRGARPGQQAQRSFRGGDNNRGGDHNWSGNRGDDRSRSFADNRGNDHRYDNRSVRRYDNNRYWGNGYRYDRHDWRRGDRLGDWNRRYYEIDYRDYRGYSLYPPPYGYHWVRDDDGDFLLAALAGGLIASIIAGGY